MVRLAVVFGRATPGRSGHLAGLDNVTDFTTGILKSPIATARFGRR